MEKLPSGLLQVFKAEGKRALAIKCFSLNVAHGNSIHNLWARMITWSPPDHEGTREYNPTVCQARRKLEMLGEQH